MASLQHHFTFWPWLFNTYFRPGITWTGDVSSSGTGHGHVLEELCSNIISLLFYKQYKMVNSFTYTSTVHPSLPRHQPEPQVCIQGQHSLRLMILWIMALWTPLQSFFWRVLLSKSCCSASVVGELVSTLLWVSFLRSKMGYCFCFLECTASLLDHLAFLSFYRYFGFIFFD